MQSLHAGHEAGNSRRSRVHTSEGYDSRNAFVDYCTPQLGQTLPSSSTLGMQTPFSYTWVPVPTNQATAGMFSGMGFVPQSNYPVNLQSNVAVAQGNEGEKENSNLPSMTSTIKEDSKRKRFQRASKREADEQARRREEQGLRPYVVQVRSSGIIDSGCTGHLKWQESVRDFTPRMLDLSIIKYEDQNQSSRDMLRDILFSKFEFTENQVSQSSFETMIKTWLRRYRERVKRFHGKSLKAPGSISEEEWGSIRKYWDTPGHKEKSEKMTETRKKVAYNPRLGRHGYAGKETKMVSSFCYSEGRIVCEIPHYYNNGFGFEFNVFHITHEDYDFKEGLLSRWKCYFDLW